MVLETIFEFPVNRPIEGVIKADDEQSLRVELEEYVLTNELAKRVEELLDQYNNYQGANGAWISGFFGSGKSHLLKMLALLLENREIDGKRAIEYFESKCGENEILRADLRKAVSIPSKSILFNVDQKADVITKKEVDALLAVFVKVFNEMRGYYGKQGHIAQFERDLDTRSLYEDFKKAYQAISGLTWENGRQQALLESQNIAEAYSQVAKASKDLAAGILDKYRKDYSVSIEDFANEVSAYLNQQSPDFHLNFFVDEVGQYIANNTKLMTNLQTIAESLETKCKGRAWIVVTAQDELGSVLGEMSKQQGEDFSKIQARFKTRMKLTSADVAEVIQKRLLLKNDNGVELLSRVYHEESNNFKTFFDFADDTQRYKNFKDRDHFIHSYPFIPYQFTLFQLAIQNLSQHNAFEGKHSSVGERSMLAVFQQVAIHISTQEIGKLATFDLMFEGIRNSLKSQIQRSIIVAENNLGNPFATRVLKALFLVKYVKEFKATVRNLSVLMFDDFDCELIALRKQIEESLNLLEQQTYIERNGEEFAFLTDEEKDIEEEIKNTDVEEADVAEELNKLIYTGIIKNNKIRYEINKQDYQFCRRLDDKLVGREYELAINVITPFHERTGDDDYFKVQSTSRDELVVVLPPDDRLMRDVLMYKQTEKYVRHNLSTTQQETVKRILTDKIRQNDDRLKDLTQRTKRSLSKATLIIKGGLLDIPAEDPQARINQAFNDLISRTYTNLKMLPPVQYSENDIAKCLQQREDGLFASDGATLSEAEQEVLSLIHRGVTKGIRISLKSVIDDFEKKPNGWYLSAILCTVAKLCARGKLEVRLDSNILEETELESALRNTHSHPKIILEPQVEFTLTQTRRLKEFFEELFDRPPVATEAKALAKETADALRDLFQSLSDKLKKKSKYPFLAGLDDSITRIGEACGKPYSFYITEFPDKFEDLLDTKEKRIRPMLTFMDGSMKALYDNALQLLESEKPNLGYLEGTEAVALKEILDSPDCFLGNKMQQVKSLCDLLSKGISAQLQKERALATDTLERLKSKIVALDEYTKVSPEEKSRLVECFKAVNASVLTEPVIAVIRDSVRRFEEVDYPAILEKLSESYQPIAKSEGGGSQSENVATLTAPQTIQSISCKSIEVAFSKAYLADEQDVDQYLAQLKQAMLREIQAGKRVRL